MADPKFPKIHCHCGHGLCKIRTYVDDNYGWNYYACPVTRGKRCKEFVKWCDEPVDESELCPSLYKYLMCSCGARVCRKEKVTSGSNQDCYFCACPTREINQSLLHHKMKINIYVLHPP